VYDTGTRCEGKVFIKLNRQKSMQQKKTLVLGASIHPNRYSYLAVQRLAANNHPVIALGNKEGTIGNTIIETEKKPFENIDTVTLYLNPLRQQEYYDYILSLHPKRIIFNPGTENDELYELAKAKGIAVEEACTIVMLSTNQY
jgi:predicted CoA-binding protein